MGVPKFYRWISERYPCLSEVVKEHQVPEFDNLYLDMNGIIHTCSHPNDEDPHFRITEEQIFKDIFHYIEVLFRIIRPQKTFFMAVDGVAPRAKMNQQRGRRFRSAKEAEEKIKVAVMKGEVLPTEKRFDSNCITPGTKFMEKLQTQLEYFVQNKITYDQTWQGVEVYLSGHQTPGEGEHKIMEYIRYKRSQPGYDPNTRHCLYGLDADLMMLALCSHEPHFSLLREEVRFTKRKDNKKTAKAEETTFHLLHVSLMREYIDHEFESLKTTLSFPYDLESIIDDWVLLGFLVGNDFIPHLPDFHIAMNALPLLYETYRNVLPEMDGYINQGGVINLERFQTYLHKIALFDEEHFEEIYEDYKWLESHKNKHKVEIASKCEEKSIQIVKDLAISQGVYSLSDSDSQEESNGNEMDTFFREFKLHKLNYYSDKFQVTPSDEQVQSIAFEYILAIQWICHYYYNGVQSWSWYYPYHYSPYVSDLKGVASMKLKYKINKPFLPHEQLLAVLPMASQDCIPEAYWHLMDEETSEIGDFYPINFSTDLNGKKQEWEAVVLIPFIDEARLLKAMEPCFKKLTKEERVRNQHGQCQLYVYDSSSPHFVKSTLPCTLADIEKCTARRQSIPLNCWSKLPISCIVKGHLPGCDLSTYIKGFSTLYHLPHTATLEKKAVKVFQAPSRNENMILKIVSFTGRDENLVKKFASAAMHTKPESLEETAQRLLGKSVYINWPHMEEAVVVAVSNETMRFFLHVTASHGSKLERKELTHSEVEEYLSDVASIKERLMSRRGIDIGDTKVLLYTQILLGCKYICGRKGEITLEKQWANIPQPYPLQVAVKDLSVKGPTFEKMKSLEDLFSKDTQIFNLSFPNYGCIGRVVKIKEGQILVKLEIVKDPDFQTAIQSSHQHSIYLPGYKAAKVAGVSPYLLARITGSIYICYPGQRKWSLGLNLKFNKECSGIAGYTKRKDNNWLYSNALCGVVQSYKQKYPVLFNYLERVLSNNGEDQINAEELFQTENTLAELTLLMEWLKSLPSSNGRKVHENSHIVEAIVVEDVINAVSSFKSSEPRTKLELQLCIPPSLLYRPMAQQGSLIPDKKSQHYLLDRVVNVRMGYTVPLGYRGTIIGIHKEGDMKQDIMFDVLFDNEFLGGLTLGGQCPERRGYKLPLCAVINLTHGERAMKTNSNRPVAIVKPHHQEHNMGEVHYSQQMSNQTYRGRFVQSPHSAFSPTKKSLFAAAPSPNKSSEQPRRIDAPHVRTVKMRPKNFTPSSSAGEKNGNSPLHMSRIVSNQSHPKQLESSLYSLDQAAQWLPKVGADAAVQTQKWNYPAVHTVRLSTTSEVEQTYPYSRLEEMRSKPSDNVSNEMKPGMSNTDLSDALKATLKINNKKSMNSSASADPVVSSANEKEKQQLSKLLDTLNQTASPIPPSSKPSAQKPFSLKNFLNSQQSDVEQMYPIYSNQPRPVLLRPDSLKASSHASNTATTTMEKGTGQSVAETSLEEDCSTQPCLNDQMSAEVVKNIEEINLFQSTESGNDLTVSKANDAASLHVNEASLDHRSKVVPPFHTCNAEQIGKSSLIVSTSSSGGSKSSSVQHNIGGVPPVPGGVPPVPLPYYMTRPPPIPPHLPVAGLPPPINFMPTISPDGAILYPPPPLIPYHYAPVAPRFYPVSGAGYVGNPFLSPVAPPPTNRGAFSAQPTSGAPMRFYPPAFSSQPPPPNRKVIDASGLSGGSIPFIPSQVISQHFTSSSEEKKIHVKSQPPHTQGGMSSRKSPTISSSVKSTKPSKKPKGKLAISFSPQSK